MTLHWQGKAKKLLTAIEVETAVVTSPSGVKVDWLVNEHCDTLFIEGHVDLDAAAEAIRLEGGDRFPAPRHTYMRYMRAPDDEPVEPEDRFNWRGECRRGERGAEPVTISVCPT